VEAQLHAFLTLSLDGEGSDLRSRPWYLQEELGALQGTPGSCGEKKWDSAGTRAQIPQSPSP